MQVHSELHETKMLYCSHCGKITQHYAKYYILVDGKSQFLRQCKECKTERGLEALHDLTTSELANWELIKGGLYD